MKPEHQFPHKLEDWDLNVFRGASHFTVVLPGQGKWDYVKSFHDAVKKAEGNPRALIYAVTASGRSTVMVRDRWGEYYELWKEREKPKRGR